NLSVILVVLISTLLKSGWFWALAAIAVAAIAIKSILILIEFSSQKSVLIIPCLAAHITLSCPHVQRAVSSNSLTPVGVALGLCSVCALKTTPSSRNNSSKVVLP